MAASVPPPHPPPPLPSGRSGLPPPPQLLTSPDSPPPQQLPHNAHQVVAEHIARLSHGPSLKQSAGTSKWSKINPKVPAHEGEEEASKGNGYRTLVDSPSEHSDKERHFIARVQAFLCLVNPKFAKLSKTQSDVNWLILHLESALEEDQLPQQDDVRAALQGRCGMRRV
ncbi:hypothetical protein NFJ02_30g78560 [Pycnococcus provasolii]